MSDEPTFREYELEVTLLVTATDAADALASVARSGLELGGLIGECSIIGIDTSGLDRGDE